MIEKKEATKVHLIGLSLILWMALMVTLWAENPARGQLRTAFNVTSWNVGDYHFLTDIADILHDTASANNITSQSTATNLFVGVQEDFYAHIFNRVSGYPYIIKATNTNATILDELGDGLSVHSKMPLSNTWHYTWSYCSNENQLDCHADKGFLFTKALIPLGANCTFFVHMYTLHADAGRTVKDHDARENQMRQLSNFMNEKSAGHPVIVMGDFNLQGAPIDARDMNILNWLKTAQQLSMANNLLSEYTHKDNKTFDYILFRNGDPRVSLTKTNFFVANNITSSDHYYIRAGFNYSINYDSTPDLVVTDIYLDYYGDGFGSVNVTVENMGPGAKPAGIPIRVDFSKRGDKYVKGYNYDYIGSLACGASIVISIPFENFFPPTGSFTLIGTVNNGSGFFQVYPEIIENNVNNNTMSKSVSF